MPIGLQLSPDCSKDSLLLCSSNGRNTQLSQNTAVGYHDLKTEFSFLVTTADSSCSGHHSQLKELLERNPGKK